MGRSKIPLEAIVFPLLIIAILTGAFVFREPLGQILGTPERLEAFVADLGWFGPAALVLTQIVQVVVFVIPGEVVQIAAGYLYGVFGGAALSMVGILLGSLFNFTVGRVFGTAFVRTVAAQQLDQFRRLSHRSGAQAGFFILFVIPGIPKDVLCYVAGVSDLRLWFFIAVSMIGRLPGIAGSALIGHSAAEGRIVLAAILFAVAVVLLLVGLLFRPQLESWLSRLKSTKPGSPSPEEE